MRGRGVAAVFGAVLLATVLSAVFLAQPDDTGRDTRPAKPPPSAQPAPTLSLAGWRPVMDENFDTIDPSRWEVLDETAHQNEESNLFAGNVSTQDGVLRIQARRQQTTTTVGGTRDYTSGHQQSPHVFDFAQVGDPTGTAWHTYTVEKTRGSISMWVDGIESATWVSGDPPWFDAYYEAGKPWDLRINLQVGSGEGGRPDNHPDASTDWSDPNATALFVDYVKVWAPAT